MRLELVQLPPLTRHWIGCAQQILAAFSANPAGGAAATQPAQPETTKPAEEPTAQPEATDDILRGEASAAASC